MKKLIRLADPLRPQVLTRVSDAEFALRKAKMPLEVRVHKTLSGSECFRLVDKNFNPIVNISKTVAKVLLKKRHYKRITRKTADQWKLI